MTDWIRPFLKRRGITSEIGPVASRDQHGHEYELLVVPFAGSESAGRKLYKESLMRLMRDHVHIIWRWRPQVEEDVGGGQRIYSRLSRYPERP
jgi:hypothetical protein